MISGQNERDGLRHRSIRDLSMNDRTKRFIDVHEFLYDDDTFSDETKLEFGEADQREDVWPIDNDGNSDKGSISFAHNPHSLYNHHYPHSNCPHLQRRKDLLRKHYKENPELWKRSFEKYRQQKFRNQQNFV